jgi:hypothetical protein
MVGTCFTMNDNQKSDQTNMPIEADEQLVESTNVAQGNGIIVSEQPVPAVIESHFPLKALITCGVIAALAGLLVSGHYILAQNTKLITPDTKKGIISTTNSVAKVNPQVTGAPTPPSTSVAAPPSPSKTTTKPKTSVINPAPAPTPPPAPGPTPNTTNCLPPNPSSYATYFTGMTNAQYLQTNSYVNTTKIYAALQFAGLINTINTKQYVVLAMDDSQWNSFTQAQLNWMNASPTNMRSVLGWQVIISCITWNGVNPVKNMAAGATLTVNTLNGPVIFTSQTSGLGKFGNGSVSIWDWFTSNGSVTIAGFVNLSSIP